MSAFDRPAWGLNVPLGTLYDARTDTFTAAQPFVAGSLHEATTRSPRSGILTNERNHVNFATLEDKANALGVPVNLAASIMAKTFTPEGFGSYLVESPESTAFPRRASRWVKELAHDEFNFFVPSAISCFKQHIAELQEATHFVAEITWGMECLVLASAKGSSTAAAVSNDVDVSLRQLENLTDTTHPTHKGSKSSFDDTVCFEVSTTSEDAPRARCAFEQVERLLRSLHTTPQPEELGSPVRYGLMPISTLKYAMKALGNIEIAQPSESVLQDCIRLRDRLADHIARVDISKRYLELHAAFVPSTEISNIESHRQSLVAVLASFEEEFSRVLGGIRHGDVVSREILSQLLQRPASEDALLGETTKFTKKYSRFLPFVVDAVANGAEYFGLANDSFDESLLRTRSETYVFHFNEQASHDLAGWEDVTRFILDGLRECRGSVLFVLLNYNDPHAALSQPRLSQYRFEKLVLADYWKRKEILATKSIIGVERSKVTPLSDSGKAIDRRPVKIPCPGQHCSSKLSPEWICVHCLGVVEYAFNQVVDRLSCDCGQWHYSLSTFKCANPTHGPAPQNYRDKEKFLNLLKALEPYEEVNILILGETGVGKSTFINAFVNYLQFQSLQSALDEEELHHLVPFAFATQDSDPSDPNKIIHKTISFGTSADERDGSAGQSATQKTQVYPITYGNTVIRLIDTPGIGDTRGAVKDKENMADILSVIRQYDDLHGILILLKPNHSKLTTMFQFCIKELLYQLHASAARNIAFGFTGTRAFGYEAGDTLKPLEDLLCGFKRVPIPLVKQTVYCFDSESFRYLAAQKQHIDLGDVADYEKSWSNSTEQTHRLVNYFRSLAPHQIKSTTSLNETRALIALLTKPMADIAQKIKSSIAVNQDGIKELETRELNRKQLLKRLDYKKEFLELVTVDQPRTVCGHKDCVSVKSSGTGVGADGKEQMQIIYETVCHSDCRLRVTLDLVNDPILAGCACMSKDGELQNTCQSCGHSWREHLHINYELKSVTRTIQRADIQAAITEATTDIQLKERGIQEKQQAIDEFNHEYEKIKEAAGKFTVFLKDPKHSILPYNNATLEYLDHIIEEEDKKMRASPTADPRKLNDTKQFRKEFVEFVELLERDVVTTDSFMTEEDIGRLTNELYNLKHYGKNLSDMKDSINAANTASFREKPYKFNKVYAPGIQNFFLGYNASPQYSPMLMRPNSYQTPTTNMAVARSMPGTYPSDDHQEWKEVQPRVRPRHQKKSNNKPTILEKAREKLEHLKSPDFT